MFKLITIQLEKVGPGLQVVPKYSRVKCDIIYLIAKRSAEIGSGNKVKVPSTEAKKDTQQGIAMSPSKSRPQPY